jgi:hypothetical protein
LIDFSFFPREWQHWKAYLTTRSNRHAKMTIAENFIGGAITVISVFSYGQLSDFIKSDFFFHIHFSIIICDFLVKSSQITIVLMHVSFIIHYKNNLIVKKDSYQISCPPSWDDRNYSWNQSRNNNKF